MDWLDTYLDGLAQYKTTVSPSDTHIWGVKSTPNAQQKRMLFDAAAQSELEYRLIVQEARQAEINAGMGGSYDAGSAAREGRVEEYVPQSVFSGSNALQNSFLDVDSNAGISTVETFNGSTICNSWKFFSPVFTNTGNYKSLAPKFFLKAQEPNNVLNPEDALQKRVVQMNGIGSTLIAFNDLNRGFPSIPMKQITNTVAGTTSPSSDWTKYEMFQTVSIPGGATTMSFGVMARVRASDALRPLNFAGVYVYSGSGSSWSVDHATICGSSVPSLLGGTSDYTTYSELVGPPYENSLYMWAGLNLDGLDRWNTTLKLRKRSQEEATAYSDWKQLSVTTTLPRQMPNDGRVAFSMFFAENHSYLDNSGTPTGSVWFYNPYVTFA